MGLSHGYPIFDLARRGEMIPQQLTQTYQNGNLYIYYRSYHLYQM